MKTLNLNIKTNENILNEDGNKIPGYEIARIWIQNMLERSLNNPKPDPKTGQPIASKTSNMETIRKYYNVMNRIDNAIDGIVKIEDDDFKWLNKNFHSAEIAIQKNIASVLVNISNAIYEAEMTKE